MRKKPSRLQHHGSGLHHWHVTRWVEGVSWVGGQFVDLPPLLRVSGYQKCRADVSFADGFRRGRREIPKRLRVGTLMSSYQAGLHEVQHAPRNFWILFKVQSFLAAFSCFFQFW